MTTIKAGDYIHHRANNTLWLVLAVNQDGTLEVERYAGSLQFTRKLKTISRPEEYRKCSMTIQTDN